MLGQARKRAYFRKDNELLGFKENRVIINWFDSETLFSNELFGIISEKLVYFSPPAIIIIHMGVDQIAKIKTDSFRKEFYEIHSLLPNSLLIFSKIIPGLNWSVKEFKFKDKIRIRLNRALQKCLPSFGCLAYRHLDLEGLFRDCIYLTALAFLKLVWIFLLLVWRIWWRLVCGMLLVLLKVIIISMVIWFIWQTLVFYPLK